MPLVPMHDILNHAYENRYAVGAFNVVNLEFLEAILETAESKRSPVILNIAQVHFPYVNLENMCPMIHAMASRSPVPVALNLDHGLTLDAIIRALRNGFTSVMFDGSKLTFEENVAKTAEIVNLCRPVRVSVEAELGAVGGDEGGGLESQADSAFFTNPDVVAEFVQTTGVQALAVAIGNTHGKYKGEPNLDFDRLEAINQAAGIPLVLHGGSGIYKTDFQKAISLGISKINIYTDMSQAALQATEQFLKREQKYHAYPEMMLAIKKTVAAVVAEQMDTFGSSGQAI